MAILDYWQAQQKARERMVRRVHAANGVAGPLTVRAAVEAYLGWLESNRKSAYDARRRAEAFIYPKLGEIECNALTADALRKWHVGLVKEPPRLRTRQGEKQKHRAFDGDDDDALRRRRESCTEPGMAERQGAVRYGLAPSRAV